MTTAQVIGIDFGNNACFIGTANAGGMVEVVLNEYSQHDTP